MQRNLNANPSSYSFIRSLPPQELSNVNRMPRLRQQYATPRSPHLNLLAPPPINRDLPPDQIPTRRLRHIGTNIALHDPHLRLSLPTAAHNPRPVKQLLDLAFANRIRGPRPPPTHQHRTRSLTSFRPSPPPRRILQPQPDRWVLLQDLEGVCVGGPPRLADAGDGELEDEERRQRDRYREPPLEVGAVAVH